MLNQKEIYRMVKDAGIDWHIDYGVGDGETNVFVTLVKVAYAEGEVAMRERAARVCRDVEAENCVSPLIDFEASECERRINALKETK